MIFPNGTTEHPINKSGKRKILVSVWDFGAVHPQSERNYYLCNDHPAKMRPCLARAIVQIYGESPVLDPMAGIGATLVEAMLLGMDAVGIEFEKKFVDQANKNLEYMRKLFPNKNLGNAVWVKGDARDLSCLNTQRVSSVIFSPPYFNAMKSQVSSEKEAMKKYLSSVKHAKRIGSIPISKALARSSLGYGVSKDNIGNVQKFGSIVFSPPYFDALSITKGGGSKSSILYEESTKELQMKRSGPFAVEKNLPTPYSSRQGNIGNISGFGSIIFSPPYFCSVSDVVKSRCRYPKTKQGVSGRQEYSADPNNIGNIAQFGSVTFSDRNNINNVNYGKSYLGEMFKVYSECFRVLKPNKSMVVVVKDIRRKGLTIPLGADTIKLCQMDGFEVFDIVVNKMYFPSFWQLTHAQKAQAKGIPMTLRTHEYVLIFKKRHAIMEFL